MAYEAQGSYYGTHGFDALSHIPQEDVLVQVPVEEVGARTTGTQHYGAWVPRARDEVTKLHDATMTPLDNKVPQVYDGGHVSMVGHAMKIGKDHDYGPIMDVKVVHDQVAPTRFQGTIHSVPMVGQVMQQDKQTPHSAKYDGQAAYDVHAQVRPWADGMPTMANPVRDQRADWLITGVRDVRMPASGGGPMETRPRLRLEQDDSLLTEMHMEQDMRFRPHVQIEQPNIMHHMQGTLEQADNTRQALDRDMYKTFQPRWDTRLDFRTDRKTMHDTNYHVDEGTHWV